MDKWNVIKKGEMHFPCLPEPAEPAESAEPGDPGESAEPGDPGDSAEPSEPGEPQYLLPACFGNVNTVSFSVCKTVKLDQN